MNRNTEFELFTQRVYQKLKAFDASKKTLVQHNVRLKGKSGCEHQIDVYWEYEISGSKHCVAIECKNYNAHVPIGKVRDFFGVLHDLHNVQGIMVSCKGYQQGAKKYAAYYGISLKELRLPEMDEKIGQVTVSIQEEEIKHLFLIDEIWAAERGFSIDKVRDFCAEFQSDKADYWRSATHLPIVMKDRWIRDDKGEILTSLEDLDQCIPKHTESGSSFVFPFDNGWVESLECGPVKIREVKVEIENSAQETIIDLAANDFVEAILEDALGGQKEYVPK